MSDNLTDMLIALPETPTGPISQETASNNSDAEAADATGADQDNASRVVTHPNGEQNGTPSAEDRPADAPTGDESDASLNQDGTDDEGNERKLPEHVRYTDFASQVHRRQELEKELEAARLGYQNHQEYEYYDNQAKNLVNPLTGKQFAGIKDYKAVEQQVIAEQRQAERIQAAYTQARDSYVTEFGVEYGNMLADLEERTARAEARANAAMLHHATNTVEGEISKLEGEYAVA